MAIKKSFGGQSILKPGSYSTFKVDNSAGSALGSNDVMLIVGEAAKGAPGDVSGITEFSSSRLNTLIETYGSGPLVDCAVAAARPSVTPGVSGAGRYLIWKTNSSIQASATLLKSATSMYNILGRAYGSDDNLFSVIVAAGSSGDQRLISITQLGGTTEVLGENADQNIIQVQYTGNGSTADLVIAGATRSAFTFTITLSGTQTDGSLNFSIALNTVTMKQLVDALNAATGYTATVVTASKSATSATELDIITTLDVKTSAQDLLRTQLEILDLINTSSRIVATEANLLGGVPDIATTPLTGGAQGASTNTDFSDGFGKSLSERYSVLLTAVSRDATDDIADPDLGFTDASSTYTLASIHAAQAAHLALRGDVKNRREAQGMGGCRNVAKASCFTSISGLNDSNMQLTIQDVIFNDATGSLRIGHPHVLAALMAGIRLGTSIGEPLTNKFIRANGIGHFIDFTTGLSTGDFDPIIDADEAIENGVTFVEKSNGGSKVVVDNTTYGIDDSFVFNRGSVIEAAYFVHRTLRETAEVVFIGKKVSNGLATSIKSVIRNKLRELNQPDVQIITSSDDAPEGFREDTFVVTVTGNTANVELEFKPVQGLDFVFFSFTLGDIQQTA